MECLGLQFSRTTSSRVSHRQPFFVTGKVAVDCRNAHKSPNTKKHVKFVESTKRHWLYFNTSDFYLRKKKQIMLQWPKLVTQKTVWSFHGAFLWVKKVPSAVPKAAHMASKNKLPKTERNCARWQGMLSHIKVSKYLEDSFHEILGGGNSNIFFHPYLGKWSKLTSIFFKGVETTN